VTVDKGYAFWRMQDATLQIPHQRRKVKSILFAGRLLLRYEAKAQQM